MTKKMLVLLLVGVVSLAFCCQIKAQSPPAQDSEAHELPPASDQIWDIFAALSRPDDPDCENLAAALDSVSSQSASDHCSDFSSMPQEMYNHMSDDGMFEEGMESTNLLNEADWHNVTNLTFDNQMGKIVFTESVDFMSRDFMLFMDGLPDKIQIQEAFIKFDASLVEDLKNMGAIITMKHVPDFSSPSILVDGEIDNDGVVSALEYDTQNHTLTFNAAHFTTFEAIESNSYPNIDDIKARKYINKNGKEKVRVVAYGHGFDKNVKIKVGSVEAYKTRRYVGKGKDKVIGFFNHYDLKNRGHKKLEVHLTNPKANGDFTATFDDKIEVNDLKALKIRKYKKIYHSFIDYVKVMIELQKKPEYINL